MRKIAFTGFVCFLLLLFGVSAYAQTYSSPGNFKTKFWMEKYFGGGDGKAGNVLMAVGEGFDFQNAVLESVSGPFLFTGTGPCGGTNLGVYHTNYTGGRLTLNPSGPWRDNIIVRDIPALNISGLDNGKRFFILSFLGTSESGVDVDVTATWCETDNNYERQVTKNGKPVFQKGSDLNADITIIP
jgi:hypothetical protein